MIKTLRRWFTKGYVPTHHSNKLNTVEDNYPTPGGDGLWAYSNCQPVRNSVDYLSQNIAQMEVVGRGAMILESNLNRLSSYHILQWIVSDLLIYGYSLLRKIGVGRMTRIEVISQKDFVVDRVDRSVTIGGNKLSPESYVLIAHTTRSDCHQSISDSVCDLARAWVNAVRLINRDFSHASNSLIAIENPQLQPPAARKNMARSVIEATKGNDRAVLVLDGGQKISLHDLAKSTKQNTAELIDSLVRYISAAFGVPPFIAGGSSDTKYNNVTGRLTALNREVFAPLVSNLGGSLSQGFGVECQLNFNSLLSGDIQAQIEASNLAISGGAMTPNEARNQFLNLPPIEGGDELRIGSSTIRGDRTGEMPSDTGSLLGDRPQE